MRPQRLHKQVQPRALPASMLLQHLATAAAAEVCPASAWLHQTARMPSGQSQVSVPANVCTLNLSNVQAVRLLLCAHASKMAAAIIVLQCYCLSKLSIAILVGFLRSCFNSRVCIYLYTYSCALRSISINVTVQLHNQQQPVVYKRNFCSL